jgi:hypothetical protein
MRLRGAVVAAVLAVGLTACAGGSSDTTTVKIVNDTGSTVRLDDCLNSDCSTLADTASDDTLRPSASVEHNVDADASAVTWVRVTEAEAPTSCLDLSAARESVRVSSARPC